MELETLLLDVNDGVATITFNRPERRNAVSGPMVVELYQTVRDLADRSDVRVVVLTGSGDRFFNPGADLDAALEMTDSDVKASDPQQLQISAILHEMPAVTVAAINGSCAGAGMGWAMACDLRLASSTAMFATAFLDIGVAGDMGLPWSLLRMIGSARAADLLFLDGKFDAARAHQLGLVSRVFAANELRAGVDAVVHRLRNAAPLALRTLKANLVAAQRLSFSDFIQLETERHYELVTGPEFKAGVAAFLSGRSAPVTFTAADPDAEPYDEFSSVAENAAEMGVAWPNDQAPRRESVKLASGQQLSVIRWGSADPELVFLHGGGQNAHTWDSVVVALGCQALAIDLPGHGRSDRRSDRNYGPWENAVAVAEVMEQLAPKGAPVVGMSLGGATNIRLAATRPDLVHRAVIVDVTPQVNDSGRQMTPEQRGTVALVSGPTTYNSFEEVFKVTMAASPKRTEAGVRRGVRHNMFKLPDGRWRWRYDLGGDQHAADDTRRWIDFTSLWNDVESIEVPTMLVLGGDSVFVLPEDVDEFRRRLPAVRVETVPGSGHAVQSDQPAALVSLLRDFIA